jgi:DNA-binding transcriptional ArsR family regulator
MEDLRDIKAKKTEKLVTAIFMVSDLMDKTEPLRNQLRSSSLKLLSDSNTSLISQIMSLISISTSIGLISDMNGGILIKELTGMKDSIPTMESISFNSEALRSGGPVFSRTFSQGHNLPKQNSNVLNKIKSPLAQPKKDVREISAPKSNRRESILSLIKDKKEVTIKDISSQISDCSEKTIQRELIALLKDKIIEKAGEKRWSRYFLPVKVS